MLIASTAGIAMTTTNAIHVEPVRMKIYLVVAGCLEIKIFDIKL